MDIDTAIKRVHQLRMQAKAADAEAKEILKDLNLTELGAFRSGDLVVEVQRNARFDAATMRRVLSPEEFEQTLVPTPSADKAKELFGEEVFSLFQKESAPKVLITRPTDLDL